jgi:hypothetical protein
LLLHFLPIPIFKQPFTMPATMIDLADQDAQDLAFMDLAVEMAGALIELHLPV